VPALFFEEQAKYVFMMVIALNQARSWRIFIEPIAEERGKHTSLLVAGPTKQSGQTLIL
jgi:hypothetical protein